MSTRTLLTTYGNDKILQAIASGTTVKIVAIAYGDGDGKQYEPSADQTSLRNELGRLTSLVKEFNPVDGFIYFKATIPANTDAFTLREFGLIDDTGGLISVTVIPDVEKPVASDGVSIALPISIGFKTSTGEVMVVVEDGTDVYATTSLNNLNDAGEHHFDNTYATINLDNLSLTGERHFLGRTHITNCITEVPQRIKYELANGTLTIKAGSVIIVPYGVEDLSSTYPENSVFLNENFKVVATQYNNNKFFVWTMLQNDISTVYTTGAYHLSVFVDVEHNELVNFDRFTDASGTSAPSVTASFYNTSTNIISRYSAGTQTLTNLSFPIVRMATTESQIASIDELFNGLSHMGSTLILDKEVRLLIPNGRNENGSLNNEPIITSEITLGSIDLSTNGTYNLFYNYTNNSITYIQKENYFLSPPNDALSNNRVYYDFTTNIYTQYANSIKTENLYCQIGSLYRDKDHATVAAFSAKFAFRAMDYNDLITSSSSLVGDSRIIGNPIITLSNNIEDDEVWLEGAVVSRTAYAKLFAIYGTTYGAGDGSTTFSLPDFRNRAIWGSGGFGYIEAGLPNLVGYTDPWTAHSNASIGIRNCSGVFRSAGRWTIISRKEASGGCEAGLNFNASWSNAIYGKSSTVQPSSIRVRVKTRYI